MERKNTVLLTVIAVATLLVAVVGATFAYYTATTKPTGEGAKVDTTTAKVGGTEFSLTGTPEITKLEYPGGIAIYEAVANAKKATDNTDDKTYDFTFSLELKGTVGTDLTGIKWSVYKASSPASISLDDYCKLAQDISTPGQTHYYYNTSGTADETPGTNDCSLTNLDTKSSGLISSLGTKVASGTITAPSTFDAEGTELAKLKNQTITGVNDNSAGQSAYYYLVLEYPNENSPQEGSGQKINVTLALEEGSLSAKIQE